MATTLPITQQSLPKLVESLGGASQFSCDDQPLNTSDPLSSIASSLRQASIEVAYVSGAKADPALLSFPLITVIEAQTPIVLRRIDEAHAWVDNGDPDQQDVIPLRLVLEGLRRHGALVIREQGTDAPPSGFGLRWFLPSLLDNRWAFAEVFFLSLVLQGIGLVTPLAMQVIIDRVIVSRGFSTLYVIIGGIILATLFETALGLIRTYLVGHTANRLSADLCAKLFRHLFSLPTRFFSQYQVGQILARLDEIETIKGFLSSAAIGIIFDALLLSIFIWVIFFVSPVLSVIVIATIPLQVALYAGFGPFVRAKFQESFSASAQYQSHLVESVSAMETIKSSAAETRMRTRLERDLSGMLNAGFRAHMLGAWSSGINALIGRLSVAAVLLVGAQMIMSGEMTLGTYVAFTMLANHVTGPLMRFATLWEDVQHLKVSMNRLGDVLTEPTEHVSRRGLVPAERLEGGISFKNIGFRYDPDGHPVLRNLSLDIKPGEMIGIVGASGSGKSTLTKFIGALLRPDVGSIHLDGMDLRQLDIGWVRRQVAYVLQENILFNSSVYENIALGNPGATSGEIVRAAKLAGAHDFIEQLPKGYETVLDERGSSLSGGQRQRIAIARALAMDPRILIFDEATSALDYESEEIILRNLRAMAEGRTVIVITHRLSMVQRADRILTLENGHILEMGSHAQLLASGGRYADLYRLHHAAA